MVYSPAGNVESLTVKSNGTLATIVSTTCARTGAPPAIARKDIVTTINNKFFIATLHSCSHPRPGAGLCRLGSGGPDRMTGYSATVSDLKDRPSRSTDVRLLRQLHLI